MNFSHADLVGLRIRRGKNFARMAGVILPSLLLCSSPVLASDGVTVPGSSYLSITGPNGVCEVWTNLNGSSEYVNTVTSGEWVNFYTTPNAATVSACYVGSSGGDAGSTCFAAGTIVIMADGTAKNIEDIAPGDYVRGRYGEANPVLGLDRVHLGRRTLYRINGHHYTTDEHPHWTLRGPTAIHPESLANDWGLFHPVVMANGQIVHRQNVGLTRKVLRTQKSDVLIGVNRLHSIDSVEKIDADHGFQLYNLVLGGSHTYFVDGYLVTGWPREDDFDYDLWRPRQQKKIQIVRSFDEFMDIAA